MGKVIFIILILLLLGSIAGAINAAVINYNQNKNECASDAKLFGLESRYESAVCQFRTDIGLWMDEKDYLLLCAVKSCP